MSKKYDKYNMPLYIIVLSLILVFPLGVYFIVLKYENVFKKLKWLSNVFLTIGGIVSGIILVYFLFNYGYYLSLIDSHMSLDMYSFSFIYFYLYTFMIAISTLYAGAYLRDKCNKLVIYTEFINIRHIKDIKIIQEETLESEEEVKANIEKLIKFKHLINVKLYEDNIVSTKTVEKNKDRLVKCKSCGNVRYLIKKEIKCDFCNRNLTGKDAI